MIYYTIYILLKYPILEFLSWDLGIYFEVFDLLYRYLINVIVLDLSKVQIVGIQFETPYDQGIKVDSHGKQGTSGERSESKSISESRETNLLRNPTIVGPYPWPR